MAQLPGRRALIGDPDILDLSGYGSTPSLHGGLQLYRIYSLRMSSIAATVRDSKAYCHCPRLGSVCSQLHHIHRLRDLPEHPAHTLAGSQARRASGRTFNSSSAKAEP